MNNTKFWKIFMLLLFGIYFGNAYAQADLEITYTAEQCAQRLYYYYAECTDCPEYSNYEAPKPIYWAKLISINQEKKEWEFVFLKMERTKALTISNFDIDMVSTNNENYLLLIDYNKLLPDKNDLPPIFIDSSILVEDNDRLLSTEGNSIFLSPTIIWCKVKYREKGYFTVKFEWRRPFHKCPTRLQVFNFETAHDYGLVYEAEFYNPKKRKYINFYDALKFKITPSYVRKSEHAGCVRLLELRGCKNTPKRLFKNNGRVITSNFLDIYFKKVKFIEKWKFE